MKVALYKIRELGIYVSSVKVATMVNRDISWVQKNKHLFVYERVNGKRNLKFELSSVLKLTENINNNKP